MKNSLMSEIDICVFACLSDNYGFLIRDRATSKVACIDTPCAKTIREHIEKQGFGRLDVIFNTHKHHDHCGGNEELKKAFGATIYGPEEVDKITPVDLIVKAGEVIFLGETKIEVLDLGGHTLGLIGYYVRDHHTVFVGDCLFPLGCGRRFEGTGEQFWQSLLRLSALPVETMIYSAHEYTLSNLAFARSLIMDKESPEALVLEQRAQKIIAKRAQGKPTVPSRLSDELSTNPFLLSPLRQTGFDAQAREFTRLRAIKDTFQS